VRQPLATLFDPPEGGFTAPFCAGTWISHLQPLVLTDPYTPCRNKAERAPERDLGDRSQRSLPILRRQRKRDKRHDAQTISRAATVLVECSAWVI